MHDALTAERLGIPAVAIVTDRFVQTARSLARLRGMPNYPFVVVEHPISDNSDGLLRAKAAHAVAEGLRILGQRAASA